MKSAPLSTTAAADALIPAGHPLSAHLRQVLTAERADAHRPWSEADGPMPVLYLSHGAIMLFEMPDWMSRLRAWARALPKPRAILIVSAHWQSAPTTISSPTAPELVYDFGGFDQMYYDLRYDTPDASQLARQVARLMPDSEPVREHGSRGLDHGAWVPLKVMYPAADIPVLQLSMPTHDPGRLMDLGRRLKPLRDSGVLVIGSGFMTHGTQFMDWAHPERIPGWSSEFDAWAVEALARGDVDELASFRTRAPALPYAHPTVEHFTPLFITLGAATDPTAPPVMAIDGYVFGLSIRSFQTD